MVGLSDLNAGSGLWVLTNLQIYAIILYTKLARHDCVFLANMRYI